VIGISSIARLDQADVLITDSGLSHEAQEQLEQETRRLVIAEPRPAPATLDAAS
jgi:DeoR/GlpR family transcriptional regulator of sugar metabolism